MKKTDKIVVRDSSGRRQFIRSGAALLLGGTTLARAQEEGGFVDCDRQGMGEEKNAELDGHDSDSGANADRPGCGQKKPAVMTEYKKQQDTSVQVVKVKA